jgi:PIN domain nuclease of toxin-antitoxin system
MRLLLDTHVLIWLLNDGREAVADRFQQALDQSDAAPVASVVSIWEIAIKVRLGKLSLQTPLAAVPESLRMLGLDLLPIDEHHVLTEIAPEPATRDPFDRLLLAQCQVEELRLITADRALAGHPYAWAQTP